ncbi:MAG: recombinase family protein [Oscillospiraceae bacterium]|nr:recombinase family protein [Oscillospiraceae bacterium]
MNKQKVNILYERLSRDDELQGSSNSILNQRQLLEEYAERNGLTPYIHICDDGYSGTNWDRPGWQELIAKVEADEVACICIKDGSRLGRDYLRAGLYRELFREKGVRLIAVNDNYDSERGEDDFTPLRALFAEWFARDTSKKLKTVFTAKAKSGKPMTGNVPYGFLKDPNDKHKWLIDPEVAQIVKRIYSMAVEGIGPHEIAKRLTADQVECPSYYLGSRGIGSYRDRYNKEHPYYWRGTTVICILSKAEYCGHTVNLRTKKENFKSNKQTKTPKEEWLVFANTHEKIISQETFDTVQKLRGTPRRHNDHGAPHPMTGLLFCADCGAKMYNRRGRAYQKMAHNGKHYLTRAEDIYECSTHKMGFHHPGKKCSAHQICTRAVKEIIIDVLQKTNGFVREHEAEFMELVRQQSVLRNGTAVKIHQKQIAKNQRRIAELDKLILSIYEDKVKGLLPEERFTQMAATYEQEQADLKDQTAALQNELDAFNSDSTRADKFVGLAQRYTHFDELNGTMIAEFIDKIVVHEGEWSEGRTAQGRGLGTRTQEVEVYLNYIGKFDVPDLRSAEEIEAERIALENADRIRAKRRASARRTAAKKKAAAQSA